MDLGASTGGFTDVLLQNGAAHVYAIDVGYGQLDWKLRNDPRVTVMERTNALPDGGRPAAQADARRDGCVVHFDYEDSACGCRDYGRGRRIYLAD